MDGGTLGDVEQAAGNWAEAHLACEAVGGFMAEPKTKQLADQLVSSLKASSRSQAKVNDTSLVLLPLSPLLMQFTGELGFCRE